MCYVYGTLGCFHISIQLSSADRSFVMHVILLYYWSNNCLTLSSSNRARHFRSNFIGFAYINTMCGPLSVGIVKDSHISAVSTGSTLAHEIGHLFDVLHDNSECSVIP